MVKRYMAHFPEPDFKESEHGGWVKLADYAALEAEFAESEKSLGQVMTERDNYHDAADNLANAIAEHLDVDIGEHSSANEPWAVALEELDSHETWPVMSAEIKRLAVANAALEARCRELEDANREFALNEAKMRTGWWIQNYQELHAKVATRDAVLRKIVETAQEHPAKANFVAVHRQIIGEARELVGPQSETEGK